MEIIALCPLYVALCTKLIKLRDHVQENKGIQWIFGQIRRVHEFKIKKNQ